MFWLLSNYGMRSLKTAACPAAWLGHVSVLRRCSVCFSRTRQTPARAKLQPRPRTGTRWVSHQQPGWVGVLCVCSADRWGQLTCCPLCLLCRRGTVTVDFTSASPQLTLSPLLRLRFVGLCLLSVHPSPFCVLMPPPYFYFFFFFVCFHHQQLEEFNKISQTCQIV